MTNSDAIAVHKHRNSSTLKTSDIGEFLMGQQEERIVSLQLLNELSLTADPSKYRNLRTRSRINVFGSR